MIEQCAALYILGSESEAIFDHEDQLVKETAAFKARMRQMQDDSINYAAANHLQMIEGK